MWRWLVIVHMFATHSPPGCEQMRCPPGRETMICITIVSNGRDNGHEISNKKTIENNSRNRKDITYYISKRRQEESTPASRRNIMLTPK